MLNLQNIQAALGYLPGVLQSVVAIENTVKGEVPGTAKKQVILDAIQTAAKAGEAIPESHVELVSGIVDLSVAFLKASGLFTSKAPAAAIPAPAVIPTPTPATAA